MGIRLKPLSEPQQPLDSSAAGERDTGVWSTCAIDNRTLRYTGPVVDGGQGGHQHHQSQQTAWRFDRVFGCRASNEIVFKEAALSLVDSAMRGVNGTVFAYGQTASGKTYTISSIVKQSARHIFDTIQRSGGGRARGGPAAAEPEYEYRVTYSSLEIYNEVVKDLLGQGQQLRVLEDGEGTSVVENLTAVEVDSMEALERHIAVSTSARAVAEHALNKASSRSHHITRLIIRRKLKQKAKSVKADDDVDGDDDGGAGVGSRGVKGVDGGDASVKEA